MTQDSRRYHRGRGPRFARAYGLLGAIGGGLGTAAEAVGSGLEAAGGAVGSGLESVGGTLAKSVLGPAGTSAVHGIESVGQGLQSLFTGGGPTEAGRLAALGQTVPEGVDLVGPSPTFTGPGFLESVKQGFIHGPQQYADASAATNLGQGVGGLLNAISQMQGAGGGHQVTMGQLQPHMMGRQIVSGLSGPVQRPAYLPSEPAQPGQGNIMKLFSQA